MPDTPPKRKQRRGITAQRTKLLKELAKGKSMTEASRAAGYSFPQAAHNALKRMEIHSPDILNRMGMPIERVFQKVIDKLEAKETLFFANKGIVLDSREVVAHDVQLHAADILLRAHRAFPRNGHDAEVGRDTPGGDTFVMVFLDDRRAETVAKRVSDLRSDGKQLDVDAEVHEDEG